MKYYLLTFNEDWADEHDVPALECFNQDDYEKWLAAPCSTPTKDYDKKMADWENARIVYTAWEKEMKAVGGWHIQPSEYTPIQKELADKRPLRLSDWDKPRRGRSMIYASLGNSGDNFGDNYSDCLVNFELLRRYVNVLEVDESFYNYFEKAQLSSLSLCNVFEIEKDYYGDEDEDDE